MNARIGHPGSVPAAFEPYRESAAAQLDKNVGALEGMKADAAARLEASPLAESWAKAQDARWGSDVALVTLLEQVNPWRGGNLRHLSESTDRLAEVVHSFDALTERLSAAQAWAKEEQVTPDAARGMHGRRQELSQLVQRVKTALAAAGSAVGNFPMAQLEAIEGRLNDQSATIEAHAEKGARTPWASLHPGTLDNLRDPAKVLGQLLGSQKLGFALMNAEKRAADPAAFRKNLAGMAVLLDEGQTAPDYTRTGKGWFHPSARKDYRARTHDVFSRFASADRQYATLHTLRDALQAVADAEKPDAPLEQAMVQGFLREVGVGEVPKGWQPTAEGVRAALEGELLVPLRALNETKGTMTKGDPALLPHVERAVAEVTQHIVEGDYADWRYDNPVSQHQLGGLDAAQAKTWRSGHSVEAEAGESVLKTREEDGLGLPWVTKIGGPSHGFDYGGECLLPLLTNGRTKAILIDDDRWPHNAAARSYIRLLHTEDGQPTLYLEPFQRDFPHREVFGEDPALNGAFYGAIVRHAVAKADQMGLPLSIGAGYAGLLEGLDIPFERVEKPLMLRASNGVYEASDTLSGKHDWPQMQDEMTEPLARLEYRPDA